MIQPIAKHGYHLLPSKQMEERNTWMVKLYDLGIKCSGIAQAVGLDYEGARRVLRKANRMGQKKRVK